MKHTYYKMIIEWWCKFVVFDKMEVVIALNIFPPNDNFLIPKISFTQYIIRQWYT